MKLYDDQEERKEMLVSGAAIAAHALLSAGFGGTPQALAERAFAISEAFIVESEKRTK